MKVTSIVGALIGAAAGALVWGALAKFLDIELGYVAWGVGIAVGGLSGMFGGRGFSNGFLCALIALAAIYGGKVLAIKWSVTPEALLKEAPADVAALDQDVREAAAKEIADSFTWKDAAEAAKENLDWIDIVFAALGVITAFKLGGAPPSEETGPMVSVNPYRSEPGESAKEPEQP